MEVPLARAASRYRDLLNAAGLGADALKNWLQASKS